MEAKSQNLGLHPCFLHRVPVSELWTLTLDCAGIGLWTLALDYAGIGLWTLTLNYTVYRTLDFDIGLHSVSLFLDFGFAFLISLTLDCFIGLRLL